MKSLFFVSIGITLAAAGLAHGAEQTRRLPAFNAPGVTVPSLGAAVLPQLSAPAPTSPLAQAAPVKTPMTAAAEPMAAMARLVAPQEGAAAAIPLADFEKHRSFWDGAEKASAGADSPIIAAPAGAAGASRLGRASSAARGVFAAAVPSLLAAAQGGGNPSRMAPLIGALITAVCVFFLMRWSKKNLEKMREEELAQWQDRIDKAKPALLKIPGVVSVGIAAAGRYSDDPGNFYGELFVDHIGPDNEALLPGRNEKAWDSVRWRGYPRGDVARLASVDGWPLAIRLVDDNPGR